MSYSSLPPDESAFRALARSWFSHSVLFDILRMIAAQNATVVLTSDHGSVFCNRATRAYGNRETTTSLRFKIGSNLGCEKARQCISEIQRITGYRRRMPARTTFSQKTIIISSIQTIFISIKRQFQGGFQHGRYLRWVNS